ncbi:MAG TPA: hypothetical protein VHM28_12715 [Anaerolineales bacterium]|nr:hypothetical protein [Anaerolineales bacterium]
MNEGMSLLVVGGTSLIASVITPGLWHNWEAVLNNRSAYILSHTLETMPPNYSDFAVWPFIGLLALTILFALLNRNQVEASHFVLLTGLATMSLLMARNIPLFAIAAAPILATWIGQIFDKLGFWIKLENAFADIDAGLYRFLWPPVIVIVAASFFVYHAAHTRAPIFRYDTKVFPVQAVDWIQSHPAEGDMFNDFNWGGYLLYRLWPNYRVFLDSQSDFYGEDFLRGYETIYTGENGWDARLNQYNVQWLIIPRGAGLARVASLSTDWQMVYQDSLAVIFERK